MYEQLVEEIIGGRRLSRADDLSFLIDSELEPLREGANKIRKALCGNHVNLCSIVNGRSGRCSENCKFCAQSSHHHTGAKEYDFLSEDEIAAECKCSEQNGVHRFSVVTAGRTLAGADFQSALDTYRRMREECPDIALCGSHGLLTYEQFVQLRESGVTTYHSNIETSRRNFPNICTTHTFDDKINCIKNAQRAGLNVCSGGIFGMGETWEDRVDMALTLYELGIQSIPLNALTPIKGTPLEALPVLSEDDILRIVVIFRFINPTAYVRLAAGRKLMSSSGRAAFLSGANATITGDMLTTSGNNTQQDKAMLKECGFDISPEK